MINQHTIIFTLIASRCGYNEIVQFLLENKANINDYDVLEENALHNGIMISLKFNLNNFII